MSRPALLKKLPLLFITGLLLGAGIILALRYATYSPPELTHYHANFAVYINGERQEFRDSVFYEDVTACSADNMTKPQQRVHMHDQNNNVVHVHDKAVTWGHFFNNLGWYVGPDFIQTDDDTRYAANEENKLYVVLNGQDYTDLSPITNMVIGDKDVLLLSYGNPDEDALDRQYSSIPRTADSFNLKPDPASCSGAEQVTWRERLRNLF